VLIGIQLWRASTPAMDRFGAGFLTSSVWNPSPDDPTLAAYGAWPFIWGTLMSSLLALLLAVPIGLGTAIFLAELAPRWVRTPVSFMVELLAAVPSVVYGCGAAS
jgi:phosphate transport system permease protein